MRRDLSACIHRGNRTRSVRCTPCSGRVMLNVYDCVFHGECTIAKPAGLAVCQTCPDFHQRGTLPATLPPVHRLAVISCHFNPAGYRRPLRNARTFLAAARSWGVPLYMAELVYDDQPFQLPEAFLQIRGSARNKMWQKERLLNLLEQRLPADVDAIAWVDADILFLNSDWPEQALAALQRWPVIQPWTTGYSTDRDGSLGQRHRSVGAGGQHPGWAWAARRDVFPLYDLHVAGSGDTMMAIAWTGGRAPATKHHALSALNPEWRETYDLYRAVAGQQTQGVGSIPGDIVHLYHGTARKRLYWDRWQWLIRHQYDPLRDLTIDPNGLFAWASSKPAMHTALAEYPTLRMEDD